MIKLLISLQADFFDNDISNKITMGIGFAVSTVCILLVYGLYQL